MKAEAGNQAAGTRRGGEKHRSGRNSEGGTAITTTTTTTTTVGERTVAPCEEEVKRGEAGVIGGGAMLGGEEAGGVKRCSKGRGRSGTRVPPSREDTHPVIVPRRCEPRLPSAGRVGGLLSGEGKGNLPKRRRVRGGALEGNSEGEVLTVAAEWKGVVLAAEGKGVALAAETLLECVINPCDSSAPMTTTVRPAAVDAGGSEPAMLEAVKKVGLKKGRPASDASSKGGGTLSGPTTEMEDSFRSQVCDKRVGNVDVWTLTDVDATFVRSLQNDMDS